MNNNYRGRMSAVLFRCPSTGKSLDVGLESDEESLKQIANEHVTVKCPFCEGTHTFQMKEARLRDYRLAKRHFARPIVSK